MVSLRCKMCVKEELNRLGIHAVCIDLGLVETVEEVPEEILEQLGKNLKESGLEILENKNAILIERIKTIILELVHHTDELPKQNYSEYISDKLGYDYTYLSNIFSRVKGVTIQQYIILNKVERAKELILYDELNLTEIAYKLHYSSVAHLSNQFKKVTGLTPTFFKAIKQQRGENLENL